MATGRGRKRLRRRIGLAAAALCTIAAGGGPVASAGAVLAAKPKPAPVNTQAPTVTGTPAVGQTLTCSTGSWNGNPNSFSYQWLQNGSAIPGAVDSTYVVQPANGGSAISCQVTASVVGGEYTIGGLQTGKYEVEFFPSFLSGNYLPQYFSGKAVAAEATPVSVTLGATTPNIGAALATGGKISGKVTNEASAPLGAISVCAVTAASEEYAGCAETNSGGEYTIESLTAGAYKVHFDGYQCNESGCVEEYAEQYYSGKATFAEAQEVTVSPQSPANGINATLVPIGATGGTISGKVEGTGKAPLANVDVCASSETFGRCEETNSSGEYVLKGVKPGSYIVSFYPESKSAYYLEYFKDVLEETEAEAVEIAGSETKTANETMTPGGEMKGKVTSESSGAGIANVEVCAYDNGISHGNCADTGNGGEYEITGLPTGTEYALSAYPFEATAYLPNSTEANVHVTAPNASEKSIALSEGGKIAGRVTSTGGTPLAGDEVCAYYESGGHLYPRECASANGNGEYTITPLASGSYYVGFSGEQCNEASECTTNYIGQYYNGVKMEPVSVTQPKTTSGINGALVEGGKITGKVTSAATGAPVIGVEVCAYLDESGKEKEFGSCGTSGESGAGGTSAKSNSVQIPGGKFKLIKQSFDAKKGELHLEFEFPSTGALSWALVFKNSDVHFADTVRVPGALAEAAKSGKGKGKKAGKSAKCKKGQVKHKGKCVAKTVSFASGSEGVAAGKVEVVIKASSKALKALKSGHKLHVSGPLDFSPSYGGPSSTIEFKATLKGAKSKHGKHGKHGKKKHKKH